MSLPATQAPGLGAQLQAFRTRLADLTSARVVVGPPPVDVPQEAEIRLHVVRTVLPPYVADQQVSRLNAHVLVEAAGPDHAEVADLIAALMLQLLAGGEEEILPGQPDLELWSALGRPPTPAFVVKLPVLLPISRQPAPPVRRRAEVRAHGMRVLTGRVLAADGTPLAAARVRISPNGLPAVTDSNGRWRLRAPDVPLRLEVTARGARAVRDVPERTEDGPASEESIDIELADVGAQGSASETETTGRSPGETE